MNDLNIQFNNYEPEMNLPEDICGSIIKSSPEESANIDLPEKFWFHNYQDFSLVQNSEMPSGREDTWFSAAIQSNNREKQFNIITEMAMKGMPFHEIERTIKLSFSEKEIKNLPKIRWLRNMLPLIGNVFAVCQPFSNPDKAKKTIRQRKGIKPVLALHCSDCEKCQYRNKISVKKVFCAKLGLDIWNDGFDGAPPKSVIDHLIISGMITNKNIGETWLDVRASFLKTPSEEKIRTYAHTAQQKKVAPGALFRKGIVALNRSAYDNYEKREKEAFEAFRRRTANPLIVRLQEAILKSRQSEIPVADLLNKTLLPPDDQDRCEQIIDSVKKDHLLWAALRTYLPAYQKCEEINNFLKRSLVTVPFGIIRPECKNCIENSNSFCRYLECQLVSLEEHIPFKKIIQSIESIGLAHRIDWPRISYCKELEEKSYLAGVRKMREFVEAGTKVPVYNGPGLQDLTALEGCKLSPTDVESWIGRKLQENVSILKIRSTLEKVSQIKNVDDIIQQAVLFNQIKPTNSNDLCLTDYQLHSSVSINRTDRCMYCQEASSLGCQKFSRAFSAGIVAVPEGYNETIKYFKDTQLSVDVDPLLNKKTLEVGIDNPGNDMTVDLKIDKSLNDLSIWQEAAGQEMEVEIDMPVVFESGLDCTVDSSSEGMVLGDELI